MNYPTIMSKAKINESFKLKEDKDKSLGLISNDVFYIEPLFKEIKYTTDPTVIIFSAPGAAGKSALSKKIAYDYNAVHWDLSQIKLGDNSFVGTLYKSVDNMNEYVDSLKEGNSFLVIDAFDEAVLVSGKKSVMDFMRDITDICKESKGLSFILLARTETAKGLIEVCQQEKVNYSHFEIDFIPEENAKRFVIEIVSRSHTKKNGNVEKCIAQQFLLIGELLEDDDAKKSFLGYPPVLEALGSAYDAENNTIKLLNDLAKNGKQEGNRLIHSILHDIIDREHNKVVAALQD